MKLKEILTILLFMTAGVLSAQQVSTLKGRVFDAQTLKALPDVNIRVEGESRTMTSADSLGNFTIKVTGEHALLNLSYPGYKPYGKYLYKGLEYLDIYLINSQVEVVSETLKYGMKNSSTAFSYEEALKGKVAGLDVTQRSSLSAEGAMMLIRGLKTLKAGTQPLIVLDGMPIDMPDFKSVVDGYVENHLNFLDVKDIEKVTVLKNGSAIYGSQAANGVILIETQRPREAKTYINFTALGGVTMKPKQIPLFNPDEYVNFAKEQLVLSGLNAGDIAANYDWINDRAGYPVFNNNTDWQSVVFNEAISQNYHLNVKGGDAMAKYSISIGYLDQQNVVNNASSSRYNTHLNGDLQILENLKMKANLGYSVVSTSLKPFGINKGINPITAALIKPPVFSPYQMKENDDGSATQLNLLEDVDPLGFSNPLSIIEKTDIMANSNHFVGSLDLEYEFNKNFSSGIMVGLDYNKVRQDLFIPSAGIVKLDGVEFDRKAQRNVQNFSGFYTDFRVNYNNLNRIHKLTAFAGINFKNTTLILNRGTDYAMPNDYFKGLGSGSWDAASSAIYMKQILTGKDNLKYMNGYADVNYAYLDKYFVSANLSLNGNSRYGANHKVAFFNAIEVGWDMAAEEFMQSATAIDKMKWRIKSSMLGNDAIGNTNSLSYYKGQMYRDVAGLVRGGIGNKDLKWESTHHLDAGLDVSLLRERLTLTIDFYLARTKDLLLWHTYPADIGYDGYWKNGGELQNSGIELSLYARLVDSDFKWNAGATFTANKAELKSLPDGNPIISSIYKGQLISKVGQSPFEFYGLEAQGVYASASELPSGGLVYKNDGSAFREGDVKYRQVAEDGVIDEHDYVSLGSPLPKFFGGFFTDFAYKGFSLNLYFTYKYGNKAFNFTRMLLESQADLSNQSRAVNARWREDNTATDMPSALGAPRNYAFSSRFIEDASFLRLSNVHLSYRIPYKNNIIQSIDLFVEGNNLLTLTKYLGYDPEFSYGSQGYFQGVDYAKSPLSKSVFAGFKLGL
ncbi:MAG: SusC/RagA family TonB-linked outer membrane protein [Porphyromonadaceae bacterium]|nr:SusC/RagA family TonB-linked outer membrane protein [Porphyromonadaceae bacterium]